MLLCCNQTYPGIDYDCSDQVIGGNENYCRVLFVGGSIFFGLFSLYLAMDIIKSIGDSIRVRIITKSLFIAVRAFLLFAWNNYALGHVIDDGTSWVAYERFMYNARRGSSMNIGVVCIITMVMVVCYPGSEASRIHSFVPKCLGYFLLAATGTALTTIYFMGSYFPQFDFYWAVASLLLIYDLQYLKSSK